MVTDGPHIQAVDLPISCLDFSFGVNGARFADAAAAVAAIGFAYIDVSVRWRFPLTTPDEVSADPLGVADVRTRVLERYGLRPLDVFAIFDDKRDRASPSGGAMEARQSFSAVVRFADRLGATGITILPPAADKEGAGLREQSLGELRWRVDRAAAAGLPLSIEPHVGSIASTPTQTLDLLEHVPGLSLTLDYSHPVAAGIPIDSVHPLLEYSRLVQVRQARRGRIQCALEEGEIDFQDIVREGLARGFLGPYSLEYVPDPAMPSDPIDVAMETRKLQSVLVTSLEESAHERI
jgi:sugar phosphate isomerase/epimerase